MKKLSKNEAKVLKLYMQGYKSVAISKILKTKSGTPYSEKTIATYKNRIKGKLGLERSVNDYIMVKVAIDKKQI